MSTSGVLVCVCVCSGYKGDARTAVPRSSKSERLVQLSFEESGARRIVLRVRQLLRLARRLRKRRPWTGRRRQGPQRPVREPRRRRLDSELLGRRRWRQHCAKGLAKCRGLRSVEYVLDKVRNLKTTEGLGRRNVRSSRHPVGRSGHAVGQAGVVCVCMCACVMSSFTNSVITKLSKKRAQSRVCR